MTAPTAPPLDNASGPLLPLPDDDTDPVIEHAKAMKAKAAKESTETTSKKADVQKSEKKEPKKEVKKEAKKKDVAVEKKAEKKSEPVEKQTEKSAPLKPRPPNLFRPTQTPINPKHRNLCPPYHRFRLRKIFYPQCRILRSLPCRRQQIQPSPSQNRPLAYA